MEMVTAGLTAAAISAAAQNESDKSSSSNGRMATTDHFGHSVSRPPTTDLLMVSNVTGSRPPIAPRPSLGRLDSGKDELSLRQPEVGRQLPVVGGCLDNLDNSGPTSFAPSRAPMVHSIIAYF